MRYAVYFTPAPDTALAAAGAAWLGRDAFLDERLPQPPVPGVAAERLAAVTADPRRYGFHATLKPPFGLAAGCEEAALVEAFERLADRQAAFATRLAVGRLGGFLALLPAGPVAELEEFAATAVRDLDRFRRAPDEAELARRRRAGLSVAEERNLVRWGYPYVLDCFRFHMTLSQRLGEPELSAVERAARAAFDDLLDEPVAVDTLGLFVEREPGGPFAVLRTASLSVSPRAGASATASRQ